MQLILASSSEFRKTVLSKIRLPFIQVSPNINETPRKNESPKKLVRRLAVEKAQAVADSHADSLIIASDQLAVCNGVIFGKPENHQVAVEQLKFLRGNMVSFYTSLVLMNSDNKRFQIHLDTTNVKFRKLTLSQIENYLAVDKPYGCAGSFKSEAFGATLFKKVKTNDPDALIGLPLLKLVSMLVKEGMDPLLTKRVDSL